MARIPLVAIETATEEQLSLLETIRRTRGGVLNLFRGLAQRPEAARCLAELGEFLRFQSSLSGALREAVILAVAAHWRCDYEIQQHYPVALRAGLDPAIASALAGGTVPASLPEEVRSAVDYAIALVRAGRVDEATFLEARHHLSVEQLVDLTILVGYYSLAAMFLNAFEIELEREPVVPRE